MPLSRIYYTRSNHKGGILIRPKILMVGAGGYGQSYLKVLFENLEANKIDF